MHPLTLSAAVLTLSSAFLLYGLSYDTRQLEARVNAEERQLEKTRSDIAVLKAERAHLARPERIEPLARAQGLVPAGEEHIARGPHSGEIVTGSTAR